MAWQKTKIKIDKDYKPNQRTAIAKEVIDFIIERTVKKHKDKKNEKFAGYSDAYKKSKAFKQAGKTSAVNLTFTGDMLEDLKLLSHRPGEITIGFENGSQSNGKAEGNIKGTYGQKSQVGPSRDFLGIQDEDLKNEVLKFFPLDDKKELKLITQIFEQTSLSAKEARELIKIRGLKEVADQIRREGVESVEP